MQERRQEAFSHDPVEPAPAVRAHARGRAFAMSTTMTFKYALTFPMSGGNKLSRFTKWARERVPGIEISLPPQVPIKTETMTVRLKSTEDRKALIEALGDGSVLEAIGAEG